jgi:hypothetical protein
VKGHLALLCFNDAPRFGAHEEGGAQVCASPLLIFYFFYYIYNFIISFLFSIFYFILDP